jgi:hypothetical protein
MPSQSHWRPALLCALLTGLLFWWLVGSRVDLFSDEGIYLDGARRILAGQAPYRDFFVLTGPGDFWNLALLFRLLGMTFAHARLLLVFDLAVLAGGLYWLTAQFASRQMAGVLTFGFVGLLAGNGGMLKVTHRWDSSAAALAGVILFWAGWQRGRTAFLFAAGMAAGYAAWITPSVLLVPAAIAVWMLAQRTPHRATARQVVIFLAGLALVSAAAVVVLSIEGSLWPMAEHLLWTSRNYSGANEVGYGSIPGGYGALFREVSGGEWAIRSLAVFFVALPALLPVVALGWFTRPRRELVAMLPLLMCAAALLLSCLPRWDLDHLEYVEPLFYVLAGAWLARVLPSRVLGAAGVLFTMVSATFLWTTVAARWPMPALETRRGLVHASASDLKLIREMLEPLPAGQSLFVYPYLPTFYFFTDAINPTRYSYLQPGMMTSDDESSVVAALERRPPCCVVYGDLSAAEILRVFPSSDPARLKLSLVANWLRKHYAASAGSPAGSGVELWLPVAGPR